MGNMFNSTNYYGGDQSFIRHLNEYLGQTVTIFTTSGGPSGCGFTGVLLAVKCDYVRITTTQGIPPTNPLSQTICGDLFNDSENDCYDGCGSGGGIGAGVGAVGGGNIGGIGAGVGAGIGAGIGAGGGPGGGGHGGPPNGNCHSVGSVCDIPVCKIASFCHNAV